MQNTKIQIFMQGNFREYATYVLIRIKLNVVNYFHHCEFGILALYMKIKQRKIVFVVFVCFVHVPVPMNVPLLVCDDCTLKMWEVSTGRCIKTIPLSGKASSVQFSPHPEMSVIAVAV